MADRARLQDWLLLLLGPVLAIALTNMAFQRWGWPLLLASAEGSAGSVDAALHNPTDAEIVVLGSSVGVFGIDADMMTDHTGTQTLNLSQHGASVHSVAMLTPDVLRLESPTVLLLISPLELRRDQPAEWRRLYNPTIAWEIYGPAAIQEPAAHLEGVLGWLCLLYRHRQDLRTIYAEILSLPQSAASQVGERGALLTSLQAIFPKRSWMVPARTWPG